MARVTVFLHGDLQEKFGVERLHLKVDNVKELINELKDKFPKLEEDVKFGRLIILINGRNIETLLNENTKFEDFDLVSLTLKDGGMIDFFPPDGGG
ncbi:MULTISPECIES: MoaD/ThiS family protein [Caldisericum]|jgi:molybdopterin converting factor small subunit|uniref:Molybdopterin synthase sulfur carrier subunit n=1 Tax=Caldisericum exile TaxID=693075 RepID=A0A2J6X6C3_9BACT|nr:MAG: molybdopterin synthase sulfur carrier subunit [Caldisericum exile]HEM55184.1 molybdopterin synthase sulfur carrier subunit [Thermodesulfobium narugense]